METRDIRFNEVSPSLERLKRHLRITSNDLDADLMHKLVSAINMAEHEISTVIAPSEYTLTGPFSRAYELHYPVRDIVSVVVDGEEVPETDYTFSECGLSLAPSVSGSKVEITYEAGLQQVAPDIQAAILLLAGSLFNNPTDHPEERDRTTARNLLRPYRTWGKHC